MAVKVVIALDDPNGAIVGYPDSDGAVIQIQRSEGEDFSDTSEPPIDLGDVPVVSDIYLYTVWDDAGAVTSWYRWRLADAGDTETGEWSAPFQGWDAATAARNAGSYATLDDLLLVVPTRPDATRSSERLARMEKALIEATELINDELEVDFWRHPQSGTAVRLFDNEGTDTLHVHEGLVTVTQVRIRGSVLSDWETLAADDWILDPVSPIAGEPYHHLVLTGAGTWSRFPTGPRLVELTCATGYPRVPRRLVAGNVAWARALLAADPSFVGGQVGPVELGRPEAPNRMPDLVWRIKRAHVQRFIGCHL